MALVKNSYPDPWSLSDRGSACLEYTLLGCLLIVVSLVAMTRVGAETRCSFENAGRGFRANDGGGTCSSGERTPDESEP